MAAVSKNREVKSVLETRIMFMVEATRFAIDRASDEELLGLQEYVYQMENCTDPGKDGFSHFLSSATRLPTSVATSLLPSPFLYRSAILYAVSGSATDKNMAPKNYITVPKKIFDCLLARDKEAVKDFITTSTMESIDGSRTIYYVD